MSQQRYDVIQTSVYPLARRKRATSSAADGSILKSGRLIEPKSPATTCGEGVVMGGEKGCRAETRLVCALVLSSRRHLPKTSLRHNTFLVKLTILVIT
jgi:hypothetical protein